MALRSRCSGGVMPCAARSRLGKNPPTAYRGVRARTGVDGVAGIDEMESIGGSGKVLDGSDVERLLLPLGKLLSPPTVPGSTAPLTLVNASFSYDTLAMGCQSYTAELPMELPWPWLDLSARDLLLVRGGVPSRAAAFCRCSPSLRVAWWLRSRWLRSR